MRNSWSFSAAILISLGISLGVAAPSGAALVEVKSSQLSVVVNTLDPIVVPNTGVMALEATIVGNALQSMTVPAGMFAVEAITVDVTDPAAIPISGLQATASNAAGSFAAGGGIAGAAGGVMPLVGVTKVCVFGECNVPPGPAANISVPITVVGAGGNVKVTFYVNVTVTGNVWTTGAAQVTAAGGDVGAPRTGFVKPGMTASGAAINGTAIRLVTPIQISTNISASAVLPGFAILDITVPEPGALALGFAAVAALVGLGVTRRQA